MWAQEKRVYLIYTMEGCNYQSTRMENLANMAYALKVIEGDIRTILIRALNSKDIRYLIGKR